MPPNLLKQYHFLVTKHSNLWAYGSHSHSNYHSTMKVLYKINSLLFCWDKIFLCSPGWSKIPANSPVFSSWIRNYRHHAYCFKDVEEEEDTCGDCLSPVPRASFSVKCFCQFHAFVKENSWKEAIFAKVGWLEHQWSGEIGILQVKSLITVYLGLSLAF